MLIKYKDIKGKSKIPSSIKGLIRTILETNTIIKVDIEVSDVAEHRVRFVFWAQGVDEFCTQIVDVFDFDDEEYHDYLLRHGTYGKLVIGVEK